MGVRWSPPEFSASGESLRLNVSPIVSTVEGLAKVRVAGEALKR